MSERDGKDEICTVGERDGQLSCRTVVEMIRHSTFLRAQVAISCRDVDGSWLLYQTCAAHHLVLCLFTLPNHDYF